MRSPKLETRGSGAVQRRKLDLLQGFGRLETILRARPVMSASVLILAHWVIFLAVVPPAFETNDDAVMSLIADGSLYGTPSPNLIFQHPAVGQVLTALYRVDPNVSWYAQWLYLAHALVLGTCVYLLLRRTGQTILSIIGFIGLWSVSLLWMWAHLQFTHAAILLGGSGLLLLTSNTESAYPRCRSAFGSAQLVMAALIRWEGVMASAVVLLPLIAMTMAQLPSTRRRLMVGLTALGILIVPLSASAWYRTEPWAEYMRLNDLRGELHGSQRLSQLRADAQLLEEVGWTELDLRMFETFFLSDPGTYSGATLERIVDGTALPRNAWNTVLSIRHEPLGVPRLAMVAAVLVFALGYATRTRDVLLLVVSTSWVLLVLTLLGRYSRLPNRVSMSIITLLGLLLLLHSPPTRRSRAPESPRLRLSRAGVFVAWQTLASIVVLVSGVLALAAGLSALRTARSAGAVGAAQHAELMGELETVAPDGVYVSWSGALPDETRPPGILEHVPPTKARSLPVMVVSLGWNSRSPDDRAWLHHLGIDDIYQSIAQDRNVYLPFPESTERSRLFEAFYLQHYGFQGLLRPIRRLTGGYIVHDALVDYLAIGDSIVETTADGTQRIFPIMPAGYTASTQCESGGVLAASMASQSDALIVALDPTMKHAVEVALPLDSGSGPVADSSPMRFSLSSDPIGRLFVLLDESAFELLVASGC